MPKTRKTHLKRLNYKHINLSYALMWVYFYADQIITGQKRGYFSPKGKKRPNYQPIQRNPEIGHIVPFFGGLFDCHFNSVLIMFERP